MFTITPKRGQAIMCVVGFMIMVILSLHLKDPDTGFSVALVWLAFMAISIATVSST